MSSILNAKRQMGLIVLLLGLTLISCKKDEFEIPEANDPVFRTDGTIGNSSFSLIAGDNNAFMHTMTDIKNGVQVFSGEINDGITSLSLGVYDGLVDNPNYEAIQGMVNNLFAFAHSDSSTVYLHLSKSVLANLNSSYIQSIDWYVDGVFKGVDEVDIMEPGVYDVCAQTTFMDGKTVTLCNQLIAGYNKSANCDLEVDFGQQGFIHAFLDNPGYPIDYVNWYLDDNFITSSNGQFMSVLTSEMHELRAEIKFTNGTERKKSLIFDGENLSHFVDDFTVFEYQAVPFAQDFNLKLEMTYDGIQYYSELANNTNSTINISGFEYYGKNSAGNEVYKVSADVNAFMRPIGATSDTPIEFTTVFGVEIQ